MRWSNFVLVMIGLAVGFGPRTDRTEVQAQRERTERIQPQFKENVERGLSAQWKEVPFHGKTIYQVIREGTNSVLRAFASRSASGLAVRTNLPVHPRTVFRWRWKIDRTPTGGSEDCLETFDHTARIFIVFSTLLGPPRTLNYLWANATPVNHTFSHPNSRRARFLVVEKGNEKAGQWVSESRELFVDYERLFGGTPPRIEAIGLMTDSDGTRQEVTGWYDDLEIARE